MNNNATNGEKRLNRARINRVGVELQSVLSGNEYKILDHLLYRSNLKGWRFWTDKISEETGTCIGTTYNVLRRFSVLGWVTQDQDNHYHFDYDKCIEWSKTAVAPTKNETTTAKVELPTKNETTTAKVELPTKNETPPTKNETPPTKFEGNDLQKMKLQEEDKNNIKRIKIGKNPGKPVFGLTDHERAGYVSRGYTSTQIDCIENKMIQELSQERRQW